MSDGPDSRRGQVHNTTKDSRGGSGNSKARSKPCANLSAGGQTNGLNGLAQSGCFAGPRFEKGTESFGEDFTWTLWGIASKLADTQNQLHLATCTGDIGYQTSVVTADMGSCMSTKWAEATG